MKKSKLDVFVGLFVLLGAAALLFLALKSANLLQLNFQQHYRITAKFDNIGGLKPRAAVKSAGVVVGRVKAISFDDKSFQAFVTLDLEQRYAFPKDSSFKILTSGLLGEQYIGIEPGGDTQNLAEGTVVTQTQSAIVLENLISQFLYSKAADGTQPAKVAEPIAAHAVAASTVTSSEVGSGSVPSAPKAVSTPSVDAAPFVVNPPLDALVPPAKITPNLPSSAKGLP
jgi:phospholipid/cholesterol/gamma-HCH transport system substrate-binding protein